MKPSLLFVDDRAEAHGLVQAALAEMDLDFRSAYSGEEGIAMAATFDPDVVLLDMELPDATGIDVCRQIRARSSTAELPVIFLSGDVSVETKVRALDAGGSDYIVKPFALAELRARVGVALRTKFAFDRLAARAQVDGLTGLHNRAFFDRRLEAELSHARRHLTALSCLMLDLDHFKRVNDTHGHSVGDEVLRLTAAALLRRCRREDVVCRYGGEEFAVLTPGVGLRGAVTLGEELRHLIGGLQIAVAQGESVGIRCSIGVAEFDASTPDAMVRNADEALYYAKRMGRDRVSVEERFRHIV
jgi:two-component system, cell cycle response regulator